MKRKEYIKYIKSEVGMKSFKSDIKETVSKLNKIILVSLLIFKQEADKMF